jgi:hypothetical protein
MRLKNDFSYPKNNGKSISSVKMLNDRPLVTKIAKRKFAPDYEHEGWLDGKQG